MTTTTNPPAAPSTPPPAESSQEQQQQDQFMKAANGFNMAYSHTQKLYQDLETDLANTTSFFGLVQDFAVLDQLCEWVSATQMMTESCASAIGGLIQGAEQIFTNGINFISTLSEDNWQNWGSSTFIGNGEPESDLTQGIPILTPDAMNSCFSNQVQQAELFISYLQLIYYDVGGAAFTDTSLRTGETVNPLSSISTGVMDDCQDIVFQMFNTYEQMENSSIVQSEFMNSSNDFIYTYTPDGSSSSYTGTYEQSGDGNNYLFDITDYTGDSSSPIGTLPSDPNEAAADIMCYAMLDWFYVYNSPVTYDYDGSSASVNAPDTSQNECAYQATTDFQGINTEVSGVSQQIIPTIAFLSNLQKNSLSMMYSILSSMANIESQAVSNMRT